MTNYYRVMCGRGSMHAAQCFAEGFIGTDFGLHEDLTGKLPDEWREFNQRYIPVMLAEEPGRSRISAGLACGFLWSVSKKIQKGDIILSPTGAGTYRAGEVIGDYEYAAGQILPHRRRVRWFEVTIERQAMSEALRNSAGSTGTVSTLTNHRVELERLLAAVQPAPEPIHDPAIEDPMAFAMEKHLEDFLVANWSQTAFAKDFAIYSEDGELVGQQYQTDAGPIDVLAISHDKKRILVVELKRGRASDTVVGQILRYMGFIQDQVAEEGQTVEGAIVALEDDKKLRWALMAVPTIQFYRYQIAFSLVKA